MIAPVHNGWTNVRPEQVNSEIEFISNRCFTTASNYEGAEKYTVVWIKSRS